MNTRETFTAYLPMPLVIMDEGMELVAASREAFSMFGLRLDAARYAEQLKELAQAMASKEDLLVSIGALTFKLRHLGSRDTIQWQDTNRLFDIEVFTLPAEDGSMHYGINFAETTLRVELERSRDMARTYLEGILESIPLGVVVMNRQMQVTAMNTKQQEILQACGQHISLLQAVGMDAPLLFGSQKEPPWDTVPQLVLDRGETVRGICSEPGSNGDGDNVFAVCVAPLKTMNQILGAVRICQDITVQTRLETKAREDGLVIARLETVKQVAVTLNHEINNSLAILMGNLDLINRCCKPVPPLIAQLLDEVCKQGTRIEGFVQRFSNIKEIKTVDYLEPDKEKMIDM